MSAPVLQYPVHHPVRRTRMGMLDIRDAKWTEVVNGGTTFTGKVTVPDNSVVIENIRSMTTPYAAAIYATPGDGHISFGGPVVNREWDSDSNSLAVTAIDWKSWFYRIVVGPSVYGNSALSQTFTNVEQLTIAKAIIDKAYLEGINYGTPIIETANYTTGFNRDYIQAGVDFKTLGAHLDTLGGYANGGFEWEVEPYYASDSYPRLRVQFYLPQRGGVVPGLVFLKTPDGGNILRIEDMEEDASGVARRVWAVGEGPNAESTPWGSDSDPDLGLRNVLRTDQVTTYSGALTTPQLASYARAERLYRSNVLGGMSFLVRLDNPDWMTYGKGDRCRIVVRDRFLNIDQKNVRILSREIDPDNNTAKITVNLNDVVLPEVDSGGSV